MNFKTILLLTTLLFSSQLFYSQNKCERLFPAVKSNDSLALTNLLDSGVNINQIDGNGATPLMWATYNGNLNLVKFLIDRNADYSLRGVIYDESESYYYGSLLALSAGKKYFDLTKYFVEELKLDINQREYSIYYNVDTGWTPLQWAVSENNIEIMDYLLQKGADPNICDQQGYAPIFLSIIGNEVDITRKLIDSGANISYRVPPENEDYGGFTAIHFASFTDSAENMIQLLLDNDADINDQVTDSLYYGGYSPLHFAILIENMGNFKYLLDHDADLSIKDAAGYTPLLTAIDYELSDFVTELLKNDVDVNIGTDINITPLHLASMVDTDLDIYKKIIDLGADVNATISDTASYWDNPGYTPLHFICSEIDKYKLAEILIENDANVNAKDAYSTTPLHISCSYIHTFAITKLLVENGADVNDKDIDGLTPLHMVCMYQEEIKTAELLIQNGAEINIKDNEGWTPVMYAALYGNIELMKLLMENDADIDLENDTGYSLWEMKRTDGSNILFNFVKDGDLDMVKMFVKRGADINAVNDAGETPIILAREYGHKKIERYLKRKGATLTGDKTDQKH